MTPVWRCRGFALPLDRTLVMGVVNVTPDSFSDGGLLSGAQDAVRFGCEFADAGADIVDVGGESTRPGADPVEPEEELRRVVPVVAGLVDAGVCVSVDTRRPEVAREAVEAGASIVNDVAAGRERDAGGATTMHVAAQAGCGIVLMHMAGEPRTMQQDPHYDDVVSEVGAFLASCVAAASDAGCAEESIVVDPGIGFGKTLRHNLELLARIGDLAKASARPVLIGTSRKSMFRTLLGLEVHERVEATLASVVWAQLAGAAVVRVHDVDRITPAVRLVDEYLSDRGAAGSAC